MEKMRKIKENWKVFLAGLGGLALGIALVVGGTTYAYQGSQGPKMDDEQRSAVFEALENSDYNAWKEAVGEESPILDKITEENFAQLAEAHKLMQEGKFDEARAIREELGLRGGAGGPGIKNGNGPNAEEREKIQNALENNDYNAWKEAAAGRRVSKEITEDEFSKLVEAHNLRKQGKFLEAKTIMEELGLKGRHGR